MIVIVCSWRERRDQLHDLGGIRRVRRANTPVLADAIALADTSQVYRGADFNGIGVVHLALPAASGRDPLADG
jgi:hypothetical protein